MPIVKWVDIFETNDLNNLLKSGKLDIHCQEVFSKLEDEIIDTFGISTEYKKLLRLKIELEALYHKKYVLGKSALNPFIEQKEEQIKAIESQTTKTDIYECIISIEKQMGFKIDYNELTIFQFYKYSNFINKINEKVS